MLDQGTWETSSIWENVAAKLKRDGYRVQVLTLSGRPGNPMPADQVSMDSYRKAIAAVIAKDKAPVALVGHSFTGFPIFVVGEAEPSKSETLVYLAAYLPQDGQMLLGVASNDRGSKAGPALQIDKEHGLSCIADEIVVVPNGGVSPQA